MNREELIRFIRKRNRFYEKTDLSFYTEAQLRAIKARLIRARPAKRKP